MRSLLLDIQLTPNNRPPPSTAVIRMHIQPGNGLRRNQNDGQLQLCVPLVQVRTDTYRGRQIVVRTTYEIEIDGQPLAGHIEVSNAGEVHYHPLPNYGFDSAIGLAHTLIDTFPEDFPKAAKPKSPPPHKHPGHGG